MIQLKLKFKSNGNHKYHPLTMIVSLLLAAALIIGVSGMAQSTRRVDDPIGIDDFACGRFLVGARMASDEAGRDYLIFYPDTAREFQVPLLKLSPEDSFRYQGINGFYEVNLPHKAGRKQARFEFVKFHSTGGFADINQRPAVQLDETCPESALLQ